MPFDILQCKFQNSIEILLFTLRTNLLLFRISHFSSHFKRLSQLLAKTSPLQTLTIFIKEYIKVLQHTHSTFITNSTPSFQLMSILYTCSFPPSEIYFISFSSDNPFLREQCFHSHIHVF